MASLLCPPPGPSSKTVSGLRIEPRLHTFAVWTGSFSRQASILEVGTQALGLCDRELCFFRTLSALRRERMVNTMFDEEPDTKEDEFGLVRRDEFWGDG